MKPRQLKFRYWDDAIKMMVYSDEFTGYDFSQKIASFFRCVSANAFNGVVQQFTGLADKNSKEIYEGDTIKYHFTEPMAKNPMVFQVFQVIWDDFYKCWSLAAEDGRGLNHTGWKFYHLEACGEVIGNIFQTPELLKT